MGRHRPIPGDTDGAWAAALDTRPAGRALHELAWFARWCAAKRIRPSAVDDATLARYAAALTARGNKNVDARVRRARTQWNTAAHESPGWPGRPVSPTVKRPARRHRGLAAFPASFAADITRLHAELQGHNRRPGVRREPAVGQARADKICQTLVQAASRLVDAGVVRAPDVVDTGVLVACEHVQAVLRQLRADGCRAGYLREHAKSLRKLIALRHGRGGPADELLAQALQPGNLAHPPASLPARRQGILERLCTPETDRRLCAFPESALTRAEAGGTGPATRLAWSKAGVAVAVLLATPLTPREICKLPRADLSPAADGRRWVPARDPRAYPLPPAVGDKVARHEALLAELAPQTPWLLPGNDGPLGPKGLDTLFERLVQPHLGVAVTPEILRHRHTLLALFDDPNDQTRIVTWQRLQETRTLEHRFRPFLAQLRPAASDPARQPGFDNRHAGHNGGDHG